MTIIANAGVIGMVLGNNAILNMYIQYGATRLLAGTKKAKEETKTVSVP